MKYLLSYLKRFTKESFLAPMFKMFEATFDLLVPLVVARMINIGIGTKNTVYIFKSCGVLILLALLGLLCSFTAQYFAAKAATGTSTYLRHDLFSHIQKLSANELDHIGTSTLITRMTSDINQVQDGINLFLRLFLRSPFIVFGSMIMAFMINFKIALYFVVVIVILFIIVFAIMAKTSPMYKQVQNQLDNVTSTTRQNLSGVRVIRAFGNEENEVEDFLNTNATLKNMQITVGKISALMNPLTTAIINIGIVAIIYTGSNAVFSGLLLSGEIVALVNYMNSILVELVKLANLIVTISKAIASMGRIETILDTKPSLTYQNQPLVMKDDNTIINFKDVSLKYIDAGEESVSNISFTLNKGEVLGVIGGTGSGKSTIVHLLMRLYDPTSGTIEVCGEDLRNWPQADLRQYFGVVMQKAQLFSGTIRSNLTLGKEDASDEELWEALEIAQGKEFVLNKPLQLDEPVKQGGRNFSGGQRQRLTIARALVQKPKVLILDDSASALDYATDLKLRVALKALKDTCVVIVSQRTSSLQHASKILVLDDGKMAGLDSHENLLKTCQTYKEIYESQFQKGEIVDEK